MRLVDVVLASVLLGLGLSLLQTGLPGRHNDAQATFTECGQSKCERMTWLRTPLTPRTTYSE